MNDKLNNKLNEKDLNKVTGGETDEQVYNAAKIALNKLDVINIADFLSAANEEDPTCITEKRIKHIRHLAEDRHDKEKALFFLWKAIDGNSRLLRLLCETAGVSIK